MTIKSGEGVMSIRECKASKICEGYLGGKVYSFRINRDIGEPSDWEDELDAICNAEEGDLVHIKINSNGGQIDTTVEMLNAIANCKAQVTTELVGKAASAASLLLLAGDVVIINQHCELMVHSATFGVCDSVHNVVDYTTHTSEYCADLMKEYYKDFLSDDEMQDVLAGKTMWMRSDEIVERLENRALLAEQDEAASELEND